MLQEPRGLSRIKGDDQNFLPRKSVLWGFNEDKGNCRSLSWEDHINAVVTVGAYFSDP